MLIAQWCSAGETEGIAPWMLSFRSPSMHRCLLCEVYPLTCPQVKTGYCFVIKNILETTGKIVCIVSYWTVLLREDIIFHKQTSFLENGVKMCVKHTSVNFWCVAGWGRGNGAIIPSCTCSTPHTNFNVI